MVKNTHKLLFFLVVSIFSIELTVMLMLGSLVPGHAHASFAGSLIDAMLLVIFLYPLLYLFFFRPMQNTMKALEAANDELSITETVFMQSNEAIMVTDEKNQIIRVNPAFTQITGYGEQEVLGCNPSILSSGRHDKSFYHRLWATLHKEKKWRGEVWNRRHNGEIFPEWLSISVIEDGAGSTQHYVAIFSDISKLKAKEEEIRFLANYDPLTKLANRTLFYDRLIQGQKLAIRKDEGLGLLFIDLDDFKVVNDNLGHAAGDTLLQQVAKRMQQCVRGTDTVARIGGDEFAVTLQFLNDCDAAARVAGYLVDALSLPYRVAGSEVNISASIGVLYLNSYELRKVKDIKSLVHKADLMMYQAKRAGKGTFRVMGGEESLAYQAVANMC